MTTKHFNDRFQERVSELEISNEEVMRLWEKSHEVTKKSNVHSESVCIHIFDEEIVNCDGENQLWVLIRDNTLVTTWRRNEDNDEYTNHWGMKVDKVSYVL